MSADYRVSAASSRWWILPPAITKEGEIDHDRLMSRVNKFFCLTASLSTLTGLYALAAPSVLSAASFFAPIIIIQGVLYIDEVVTDNAAKEINAKKTQLPPPEKTSGNPTGHRSLSRRVSFVVSEPEQGYSARPLPELSANQ